MKLISFKPLAKGALRGFATVELPNGLILKDISILVGRTGPWANLPAKPRVDRDGKPKLGTDGRALYVSIIAWRDRDLADRWSNAVIELLLATHPRALDEGGGG